MKLFLFLGAVMMSLSVALGAFGAHGLKSVLSPEQLAVYQTGVHYQMIHGLGLILIAILMSKYANMGLLPAAGWAMLIGIILFSGSLYALTLTGVNSLGIITPFGGVAFLIGWILLAIAAFKLT
ncbi:DUF423 domain-containing protein [Brevibacillus ginsengisoli]|uniref:DUF423 domain-containing protein n=1 Tax=Brevibacillus ginsengisoli TaxID=363854 RepID=UPI003CEC0639